MHLFGRMDKLDVGIHVEARTLQPLKKLPLGIEGELAFVADGVYERGQVAMRRDLGVLLAQASRRRIARVREPLLAVRLGRRVQRLEARLRHVALAAQFDRDLGVLDAVHRLFP